MDSLGVLKAKVGQRIFQVEGSINVELKKICMYGAGQKVLGSNGISIGCQGFCEEGERRHKTRRGNYDKIVTG